MAPHEGLGIGLQACMVAGQHGIPKLAHIISSARFSLSSMPFFLRPSYAVAEICHELLDSQEISFDEAKGIMLQEEHPNFFWGLSTIQ